MSTKIRWFGVLNDTSLAPSGINSDRGANVIVIASLTDAELILEGAWRHSDPSRYAVAADLDGVPHGATPAMSDEITLTLWAADTDTEPDHAVDYWTEHYEHNTDPYPDCVLSIGPRGGIKRERA